MKPVHLSRQNRFIPSNWRIEQLPGLSAENQAGLIEFGIKTTLQLLQQASSPVQRQALATQYRFIFNTSINGWLWRTCLAFRVWAAASCRERFLCPTRANARRKDTSTNFATSSRHPTTPRSMSHRGRDRTMDRPGACSYAIAICHITVR